MLQRFRWMGGNGLLFLHTHRFGSAGFLAHGNSLARAARVARLNRAASSPPLPAASLEASGTAPLLGSTIGARAAALSVDATIGLPTRALPPPGTAITDGSRSDSTSGCGGGGGGGDDLACLAAVGCADCGLGVRRARAVDPLRKLALWSIYDVGMGYMFSSTLWHVAFHALMVSRRR